MPKALICKAAGEWQDVLSLQEVKLPPELSTGQVRLKMLTAAIHPSDFGMIAGTYGKARTFPTVLGREGIGEVIKLGSGAANLKVGDWVRIPEEVGAWQEQVDVPAAELMPLPKNIPVEQLALSFINPPTVLRVLEDFVKLQPGDSVITNAGKSAVSVALLQLCKSRSVKAYAVVRNKTTEDVTWLETMGAEGVLDESEEYFKTTKAALVLNQVGGESVLKLIKALRPGGVCVTIGGATKELIRYPTRELIFNDVQLRGFYVTGWFKKHSPEEGRAVMEQIWQLMRQRVVTQEVNAHFKLAQFAEAFKTVNEPGRRGKVVFVA